MADVHENHSDTRNSVNLGNSDFEDIRNSIQYRYGMYFVFCTILFFQCINWILKSQGPPKKLKHDEWKWRNLYVSWIHACIASVWTLSSLIFYPVIWQNVHNLLTHINLFTYYNVCFSLGYFFYDFLDLIINNRAFEAWEVSLHHCAVAGMFYYNVHIKSNIGFNLLALCVEVNSVFLHWRKLLQMVGTPYSDRQYTIIKHLNLWSFVIFRFGPLIAITTSIFFWRLKVSQTYYVCLAISMIFMDLLNTILFKRLFFSDILRSSDGTASTMMQTLKRDFKVMFSNAGNDRDVAMNNNVAKMVDEKKKE